jgi:hypothetical protein
VSTTPQRVGTGAGEPQVDAVLAGGQVQLDQAVARAADGHRGVVHRGRPAGVVGHCGDHGQSASSLGGPPQVLGLLLDHNRRQAERQGFLAGRLQQVAGRTKDRDRVEQRQSGQPVV